MQVAAISVNLQDYKVKNKKIASNTSVAPKIAIGKF